jgi:hypothetical protein
MAEPEKMGDSISKIVLARFRDAVRAKSNNSVFQGKSTIRLLREADYAMEKRYTYEMNDSLTQAFGFCPTGYYGLSLSKTRAIADWKSELVAGDPGALIQVIPTPNPRLPESSVLKIKESVKDELIKRMIDAGVGDPSMLIQVGSNRLHSSVKAFLDEKAGILRQLEQAKISSAALTAAGRVQNLMRDVIVEGDFREAYSSFSMNQIKYGLAFMRFPYWQRRVLLSDKQDFKGKTSRQWKTVPTFQSISPWNFFPMNDGRSVAEVTACMEYREINKATLVGLTKDSRYDEQAILGILDDYSMRSRAWLFPETSDTESENGNRSTYWGPEELVGVIHHEGFVTGYDLHEFGLTGYEDAEQYNIQAEVCCGRTIRVSVKNPTSELPRSYAAAKYEDLGPGVWNGIGVPGILQNTQDRINTMMQVFQQNMDWSMRPPLQVNSEALKNPGDAMRIVPGGRYEVSDLVGAGSMPDPIRAIRGSSAQYQIVWPLIQAQIRQADSEVLIPELSDLQLAGRGSLGELSARISAAVRRVRSAAFSEDRSMAAIWRVLFEYVLDENPEVVEDVDLDFNYRGVVGLLAAEQERKQKMERLALVSQAAQAGSTSPEVLKYAFMDAMRDAGVPLEALGQEDPLTSNAIAIAMQNGPIGGGGAGSDLAGAPQLDGRSGSISQVPTAIAASNGSSQIVPPVGM